MSSAQDLLSQLQTLVPQSGQAPSEAHIKQAQDVLRKLKLELVKAPSSSDVSSSLLLQRTTLELAAFLSLYARDVPAFVRYITQLKTSYNDMRALLPPSKAQAPLLGAYLLCLLSQNQIADFHTEYDLLAYSATSNPASRSSNSAHLPPSSPTSARSVSRSELLSSSYIAFPVALEQQLMEGCYSQILAANADSSKLPSPVFALFLDTLAATVRGKIADCSEQAYASLSVKELASMLRLASAAEAEKFVAQRPGWTLTKGANGEAQVDFGNKLNGTGAAANKEINAHKLIQQTLAYATELERIV